MRARTESRVDQTPGGDPREEPVPQRTIAATPLRLGVLVGGALLSAFVVVEFALGRLPHALGPGGELRDVRIAVVHCLLLGYLVGAFVAIRQGAHRTAKALGPALDLAPSELARVEASVGRFSRRSLIVAGAVGLLLAALGPYLTPPIPDEIWNPRAWSPEVAWHRTLGPAVSLMLGWFGYALVESSRRVSRLAGSLKAIDLLDLRPLAPFAQMGLRNALVAVGLLAVGSLFLLESGFMLLVSILGTATLLVAALALLLPVRGAHLRIRAAKQAELAWSRERIRAVRSDLKSGGDSGPGKLADLAAYHGVIQSVPEWPIALSTYVRFTLYLLLPLAAWVAGALVDGLVQSAFAALI